jgi:hypothetical protein
LHFNKIAGEMSMAAPPPPPLPLPRAQPPTASNQPLATKPLVTQARDENDYIEPQMVADNMFDDDADGPFSKKVRCFLEIYKVYTVK